MNLIFDKSELTVLNWLKKNLNAEILENFSIEECHKTLHGLTHYSNKVDIPHAIEVLRHEGLIYADVDEEKNEYNIIMITREGLSALRQRAIGK